MEDEKELAGKTILVGLIFRDSNDQLVARVEKYGVITKIEDGTLVFEQANGDGEFSIPYDIESITPGKQGVAYRLESTGEVVKNVDYISTWTIQEAVQK
jgi:hypothetical protein